MRCWTESAVQQEIKEKHDVEEESHAEKEVEVTGSPCAASEKTKEIGSEKTKEPVYSITKSDFKNSETGGIKKIGGLYREQ